MVSESDANQAHYQVLLMDKEKRESTFVKHSKVNKIATDQSERILRLPLDSMGCTKDFDGGIKFYKIPARGKKKTTLAN